jgi:hypothetical protein
MEVVVIYDKAKYHYEDKFPKTLPKRQATCADTTKH